MDFESFVLAASTSSIADANDPVAREYADAVEFRMDLAEHPLEALDDYEGELPVVATNRVEGEGGGAPECRERLETLRAAARQPAVEAVDVELEAARGRNVDGLLAGEADVTTIVSIHDFERTPPMDELRRLLEAALQRGDVGKLAVTAETVADVPRLLEVTAEFDARGQRVATMAMGEPGRHSRVVAPVYGSRIGYAPVRASNATAPGQYDLATLAQLVDGVGPAVDG